MIVRVSVRCSLILNSNFNVMKLSFTWEYFRKFYRENFVSHRKRRTTVWFGWHSLVAFPTTFMTLIPLCILYLNLELVSYRRMLFAMHLFTLAYDEHDCRRNAAEVWDIKWVRVPSSWKIGLWQREIFLAEYRNDHIWPMHYHMQFVNECHSLKWMLRLRRLRSFT